MELLNKSGYNFQSAKKLIEYSLYAPSVHCSYYSCFQHLVVKTIECSKKPLGDLQSEMNRLKSSTHTFYMSKLSHYYRLKPSGDYRGFKKMKSKYENLKNIRIDADYYNNELTKDKAIDAFENCKEINDFLKSIS